MASTESTSSAPKIDAVLANVVTGFRGRALRVQLAYDDYVGGDTQTAQLATEPDRLRPTVLDLDLGLDHEEVEVAVGAGIASGMRSEQDDLR